MQQGMKSVPINRSAGDSLEQRQAEEVLVARLAERLGLQLRKRRLGLPEGGSLEINGVCDIPAILCEAWAHQGKPKSAQKNKVMADELKMLYAKQFAPGRVRMILLFGGQEAASHFLAKSWMAQALRSHYIEIHVVRLPENIRKSIRKAQKRQFR